MSHDNKIYEWNERAFLSDAARFQRGELPPLRLFDGLRAREIVPLLMTPPRYCPIYCGLSYGAWYEFPEN